MAHLNPNPSQPLPDPLHVGIEGLPASVGAIRPGRLYGLVSDSELCLALLWPAALAAARDSQAALVTAGRPENLLAPGDDAFPGMRQALHAGSLHILQYEPQDTPAADARRMRAELAGQGLAADALIILHDLDLPATETRAYLSDWRRWTEAHRHAVLMVFLPREQNGSAQAAMLRAGEEFAGLARLAEGRDGAELDVLHWFGMQGGVSSQRFPLARPAPWRLSVRADAAGGEEALPPAFDERAAYAKATALAGFPAPSGWIVADSIDALLAQTTGAVAATCILTARAGLPFATLLHAVFTLRRRGGRRLKIVVRETDLRLRYSQESLLLRLGANLVVPAEVSHPRFLGLLETLQGQIFTRTLPSSYEEAVAGIEPVAEPGYLPAADFAACVRQALARSAALGVDCALVRLTLVAGLTALDALRCCALRRGGDLCSAAGDSVYVFLFACREADVGAALDRLFVLPVDELFQDEVRHLSRISILEALDGLAVEDGRTDLQAELAAADLDTGPGTPSSPRQPDWRAPPAAAVRRPFRLRAPKTRARESVAA